VVAARLNCCLFSLYAGLATQGVQQPSSNLLQQAEPVDNHVACLFALEVLCQYRHGCGKCPRSDCISTKSLWALRVYKIVRSKQSLSDPACLSHYSFWPSCPPHRSLPTQCISFLFSEVVSQFSNGCVLHFHLQCNPHFPPVGLCVQICIKFTTIFLGLY
jgi:hypothetical protein